MKRREAIKSLLVISAAGAILTGCEDKSSIALKNISVTGSDEDLIADLAETIIPTTASFEGAKDLRTQEFVLMMVDECMSSEDQKKFLLGMKSFDEACQARMSKSFVKCSPEQRNEFVTSIDVKSALPEDAVRFYQTVKGNTLRWFMSAEKYMLQVRNYKMLPGKFHGCVAVQHS